MAADRPLTNTEVALLKAQVPDARYLGNRLEVNSVMSHLPSLGRRSRDIMGNWWVYCIVKLDFKWWEVIPR